MSIPNSHCEASEPLKLAKQYFLGLWFALKLISRNFCGKFFAKLKTLDETSQKMHPSSRFLFWCVLLESRRVFSKTFVLHLTLLKRFIIHEFKVGFVFDVWRVLKWVKRFPTFSENVLFISNSFTFDSYFEDYILLVLIP